MEDDLDLEDDFLAQYRSKRMEEIRTEVQKKRAECFGTYAQLSGESQFTEIIQKKGKFVCHFFHEDFPRCKILDKHLEILASRFPETQFGKLEARSAPFFTAKLNIQVLPCLLVFKEGSLVDRTVGFEEFGNKDDFKTADLEARLLKSGVVSRTTKNGDNDYDD